ncbi:hypothetical protein GCK32_003877 [Trichostrongylus colubriformis]|uniref:Coiled-coil domain-containing protein 93 n=1 Tax=Trichostrongylus colubriformis TaxID=6319 RepID=A0AAN8IU57_TRICO
MSAGDKMDTNEDDENNRYLMDCLDLLVAAGYFRARIKGLATFDKIVGGMVWCLYHCNRTIDTYLVFIEDLDIGHKIALTEKVVRVLSDLRCPHPIEPHQIQGLDLQNIYPVIQWLVKMAMESKASRAESLKSYIDYQYNKSCRKAPVISRYSEKYNDLHKSIIPQRKFKRGRGLKITSLLEDAYCTLAEFTGRSLSDVKLESGAENPSSTGFKTDDLEELGEKKRLKVTTKTAKKIFEEIDYQTAAGNASSAEDSEAAFKARLAVAEEDLRELETQLEAKQQELAEAEVEYEAALEKERKLEELHRRYTSEEIEEARKFLEEVKAMKKREKEFRENAEAELEAIRQEIRAYEHPEEITEEQVKEMKEKLAAERLRLAEVNQRLVRLSYELDNIPTDSEMAQYQQRLVELYNEMGSKNRQTKQYITLHNTLLDVRDFTKKDIEMLSKIEEVLPLAKKESYRDSFIDTLNTFYRGAEAAYRKVTCRTTALMEEKTRLTAEYNEMNDQRREFSRLVERMKEECERNQQLRRLLAQLEREEAAQQNTSQS